MVGNGEFENALVWSILPAHNRELRDEGENVSELIKQKQAFGPRSLTNSTCLLISAFTPESPDSAFPLRK